MLQLREKIIGTHELVAVCTHTKSEIEYLRELHAQDVERIRQMYELLQRKQRQTDDLVTQVNALIAQAGAP